MRAEDLNADNEQDQIENNEEQRSSTPRPTAKTFSQNFPIHTRPEPYTLHPTPYTLAFHALKSRISSDTLSTVPTRIGGIAPRCDAIHAPQRLPASFSTASGAPSR